MQKKFLITLITIATLYAAVVFATPVDQAILSKYDLTLPQVKLLNALIILPLCFIWATAFYGLSKFDAYAQLIQRDRDGAAFKEIARGLMILAIGTAVAALVSAMFNYYTHYNLEATRVQVIVGNYLNMLITVGAFYFMYRGACRLCKLTRKRYHASGNLRANLIYIALATFYTYLFLANLPEARDIPLTPTSHAAYYTPTWLLIPTLLIPYLIAWYLGSMTIYLLNFYTKHIAGSLYSRALRYLSYGLAVVIVGSVVMQILTVLTGQLQSLSTASILIVIYLLLALLTAGYIPIAIGAKKLAKIETV